MRRALVESIESLRALDESVDEGIQHKIGPAIRKAVSHVKHGLLGIKRKPLAPIRHHQPWEIAKPGEMAPDQKKLHPSVLAKSDDEIEREKAAKAKGKPAVRPVSPPPKPAEPAQAKSAPARATQARPAVTAKPRPTTQRSAYSGEPKVQGAVTKLRQHMKLREAIENFRALAEAKVGDYITTKAGDKGYVQSAEGGKLAVRRVGGKPSSEGGIFYVGSGDVTVNPGGPVL